MEAQRYPEDFDGIIAGAPANNQAHLSAWRFNLETTAFKDEARVVPPAKTAALNKAVLAACDALDGVKDGFLADPRMCSFDPSMLLCRDGSSADCLTAPQIEMVKMAHAPALKKNRRADLPRLGTRR